MAVKKAEEEAFRNCADNADKKRFDRSRNVVRTTRRGEASEIDVYVIIPC